MLFESAWKWKKQVFEGFSVQDEREKPGHDNVPNKKSRDIRRT